MTQVEVAESLRAKDRRSIWQLVLWFLAPIVVFVLLPWGISEAVAQHMTTRVYGSADFTPPPGGPQRAPEGAEDHGPIASVLSFDGVKTWIFADGETLTVVGGGERGTGGPSGDEGRQILRSMVDIPDDDVPPIEVETPRWDGETLREHIDRHVYTVRTLQDWLEEHKDDA